MNIQPAAALLLFSTLAVAQLPPISVLVALQTTTVNQSLVSVDTAGAGTLLTNHGRGAHNSVALDRHDPAAAWGLGAWPTIGTAPVGHYLLKGLDASNRGAGDGLVGTFGKVERCHVYGDDLLITFSSVTPGLYRRARAGGTAVLVAPIADAFDLCVRRGKVYVTRWSPTLATSELIEVDMSVAPAATRVVAIAPSSSSAPQLFKACCSYGWEESALYVALGDSAGKIWFVDPDQTVGNAFSLTFGASRGVAEAMMTHPDQRVGIVVATSTGLYTQTSYNTGGQPFYQAPSPIRDIAVLGGGSQTYGRGCAGSRGEPMHRHGLNGWPYHGNSQFTIELGNGPPGTPGTLAIGLSRAAIDLQVIGAPQCFLNLDIALQLAVSTDASGVIVLPAPIPSAASLIGARVLLQWGIFESGANAAGLITSAGLEHVIR